MAARVDQRIGQPVGQQPRAHRRDRAVEHRQQRALAAALADRARDLQAAAARFVDLQRARAAVGHQPVDVLQRGLLRFVQVVDDGAGGAEGLVVGRLVGEAEAFQRGACRNA